MYHAMQFPAYTGLYRNHRQLGEPYHCRAVALMMIEAADQQRQHMQVCTSLNCTCADFLPLLQKTEIEGSILVVSSFLELRLFDEALASFQHFIEVVQSFLSAGSQVSCMNSAGTFMTIEEVLQYEQEHTYSAEDPEGERRQFGTGWRLLPWQPRALAWSQGRA
jgi:hypothetical protein